MKQHGQNSRVTLRIGNSIVDLKKVVDFVEAFAARHGVPGNVANDLNLCLDEILNNTISYGYDNGERHSIFVSLSLEKDVLVAEIRDDARPFDPLRSASPDLEGDLKGRKIGGVGLHFVKTLMDEMAYVRTKRFNRLTLRKTIAGGR
jgi:serine/threonine-protein kinase RsbW